MQKYSEEFNQLGELIRTLRKEKGLSQEELAEISGIPRSTIHVYEAKGVAEPKAAVLLKIASALNVDIGIFYAAAGMGAYINSKKTATRIKDLLDELYIQLPVEVPVYDSFSAVCGHIGKRLNIEPINIIYRSKANAVKYLEAYVISNSDMAPLIEAGDILVIDRTMKPGVGNIVLCLSGYDKAEIIGKVVAEEDTLKVVNNSLSIKLEDCSVCCVVITMRRNFASY